MIGFSPDGKTIAVGYGTRGGDGVVLWDVAASKRLFDEPLALKEGMVQSVAFSPDGKTIAVGYNIGGFFADARGGVILWDVATGKRLVDQPLAVNEGGELRCVRPRRQKDRGRIRQH